MNQREMCEFVKLVLDRMDTNPDEFEIYGRWDTLCQSLENHNSLSDRDTVSQKVTHALWPYDDFEIAAMTQKYRAIRRDHDHKAMLKSIIGGNQKIQEEKYAYDSPRSVGITAKDVASVYPGAVTFQSDQNTSLGQYLKNKLGGS